MAPPALQVRRSTPAASHTDFTCTFPATTVPTGDVVNTVSSSWAGGTSGSPQTIPRTGDRAASDGKYYYTFGSGVNINMDSNKVISITQPVVFISPSHAGVQSIHTSSNANINVTAGKTGGNLHEREHRARQQQQHQHRQRCEVS
jgi:hypothetical protein